MQSPFPLFDFVCSQLGKLIERREDVNKPYKFLNEHKTTIALANESYIIVKHISMYQIVLIKLLYLHLRSQSMLYIYHINPVHKYMERILPLNSCIWWEALSNPLRWDIGLEWTTPLLLSDVMLVSRKSEVSRTLWVFDFCDVRRLARGIYVGIDIHIWRANGPVVPDASDLVWQPIFWH